MDSHELDQAVNRKTEQAYWPWWLAVAYVLPKPERYNAMRGAVETHLAFKDSSVDAAAALGRVVAELNGGNDLSSETFRVWRIRSEDSLMLAVRSGQVRAWGRPTQHENLIELEPSDWIGSEVDCSVTCDLVQEGWRDKDPLSQALHGERVVRFSDIHLPREQVIAWADQIESAEASKCLDDALAGDYEAFAAIESEGQSLEGGFWSAFVACAWVGSRCERFTAAAQVYERAMLVERGGPHSASAWLVLGNVMGKRFGLTTTQATGRIQSAIADRQLSSGVGYDLSGRCNRDIAPAEWLGMEILHDQHGTSLVPGIYRVSWPSADVRSAFLPGSPPVDRDPALDLSGSDAHAEWALDAARRGVTVTNARRDARDRLGDDAPGQDAARVLLKEAKEKLGCPVRRGRPIGSKSFSGMPD